MRKTIRARMVRGGRIGRGVRVGPGAASWVVLVGAIVLFGALVAAPLRVALAADGGAAQSSGDASNHVERQSPLEGRRPDAPSAKTREYQNAILKLRYPDNWKVTAQGSAFKLAPEGGAVDDGKGGSAVAYGALSGLFGATDPSGKKPKLEDGTNQLIGSISHSNPNLRVERPAERIRVDGREALSTYLSNDSPAGGRETDLLVTTRQQDAVLYFLLVAPQGDFGGYAGTFNAIVASIRWR